MNEQEAREWLSRSFHVPRETIAVLERLTALLTEEASRQNLIATSTLSTIWSRHIADSAQLLLHAQPGAWLDLGSGAGFPGLVAAIVGNREVTLVETRRLRVAFLELAVRDLDLQAHVTIIPTRVEAMPDRKAAVISARAFAPLDRLFAIAHRFSVPETLWLLPKGRTAANELEAARRSWQGDFSLVPSVTDPQSAIIVARDVRPKGRDR